MSHLTDLTLNAYVDSDLDPAARREADAHLATCPECAARLAMLHSLVTEIESLPDLPLQRDLSRSVVAALQPKRVPVTKPTLNPAARLVFALQALVALAALAIALPFAAQLIPAIDLSALANAQSLISDLQSPIINLQLPTLDFTQLATLTSGLPTVGITTLIISAIAITLLWFVGNGLLLRLNSLNPQPK
jgi:hypothetical protein